MTQVFIQKCKLRTYTTPPGSHLWVGEIQRWSLQHQYSVGIWTKRMKPLQVWSTKNMPQLACIYRCSAHIFLFSIDAKLILHTLADPAIQWSLSQARDISLPLQQKGLWPWIKLLASCSNSIGARASNQGCRALGLKMATGKIRADMSLINPHPQAKTRARTRARNPLRA